MALNLILFCVFFSLCVCQEPSCSTFALLANLLEKVVRMEAQIKDMQSNINTASDLIGNLQQAQNESSRVAFFATASESQSSLSKNQIIQFDHVWTNVGHVYDSLTGIFTAPVNGTYSFQTTILSDQKNFWGYLAVNGHLKCSLYAGTDNRVSVSQSLIVTLQEGDQVTVRNNNDEGMIYGSYYTTFGGYSLFS